MDVASIAAAFIAAQMAQVQTAMAAKMLQDECGLGGQRREAARSRAAEHEQPRQRRVGRRRQSRYYGLKRDLERIGFGKIRSMHVGRGDQLERVLARPFRRTRQRRDLAAVRRRPAAWSACRTPCRLPSGPGTPSPTGRRNSRACAMPTSFSQAFGFCGSRVSMLTATTSNSGPPSLACSASSAGISLRQGTHQVAHRLNSTVRPRQSASVLRAPASSWKASSGRRFGRLRRRSGRRPRRGPAARSAARFPAPGRHSGATATLPARRPIPYIPASPTATPAKPPARTMASRFLALARRASAFEFGSVMIGAL